MLTLFLMLLDDENDKLTFEILYNKYRDAGFRRALRLLNNNHFDADEASQRAWVTVYKNFDKLKSKNEHVIATYLFETIKYKAIDVASDNKKWGIETDKMITEDFENVSDDLLFAVCAKEKQESINKVFCNLDETYRDVLIFHFLDGLSIKEIASQMGINEKTVWTKLYRGKRILVEELKKEGVSNE